MRLVIVGCGKTKRREPSPARELYTGPLFKLAREYAERNGDAWLIASAKFGLVRPERIIPPYNRTLEQLDRDALRQFGAWSQVDLCRAFMDLGARCIRGSGWQNPPRVVFLAGKSYVEAIVNHTFLANRRELIEQPLAGMGIGERLAWLKRANTLQGAGHDDRT